MTRSDYTRCPFSYGMFLGTATVVVLLLKKQQRRQEQEQEQVQIRQTQEPPLPLFPPSLSLPVSCEVVFVLGGPGAGKGTQCQLLQQRLKGGIGEDGSCHQRWVHLSAGDLLRAERQAGGPLGDLINAKITAGELVPSHITCQCLEKAMAAAATAATNAAELEPSNDNNDNNDDDNNNNNKHIITTTTTTTKFLIDGFPRSHENMKAWEDTMSRHTIKFVLNFECPEEIL
jgi:UMP-CMP kinase